MYNYRTVALVGFLALGSKKYIFMPHQQDCRVWSEK